MFNISCQIAKLVTLMVLNKMLKCKCNMLIILLINPLTMRHKNKVLKFSTELNCVDLLNLLHS